MVSNKVINAACFSLYDVHYIFISQQDQYEFCHQVLADFLDAFDTYANFKEIIWNIRIIVYATPLFDHHWFLCSYVYH